MLTYALPATRAEQHMLLPYEEGDEKRGHENAAVLLVLDSQVKHLGGSSARNASTPCFAQR